MAKLADLYADLLATAKQMAPTKWVGPRIMLPTYSLFFEHIGF